MEVDLTAREDGVRGDRVGAGPGGAWAVAGDWELTASWAGGRVHAPSRERLAGVLRFDGDRLWVGGARLDLASGTWEPLPPLAPALSPAGGTDVDVHDAAWVGPGHLAVTASHRRPPRRKGPATAWRPWERLVVIDAETREVEAVLQEGGPAAPVRLLAAAGETLVGAGQGVRVWRDMSAEPEWLVPLGVPQIEALALRADGLVVAAAPSRGDVLLRSPEGALERELPGTAGTTALALHPRATVVAVGGLEGVELRSLDGDPLWSAASDTPVLDLAFSEEGERLLVLDGEGLTAYAITGSGPG